MARHSSPRRNRPKLAGALLSAIAFCGGCSLLFHADPSQCSSTTDCAARGPAFANHVCMSGTCVAQAVTINEGGVDAMADAAKDAGVDAEAGPPPDAGCKVAADCTGTNQHPEVACDVSTGNCLQLTTDECPIYTTKGDFSGTVEPPIFIGAFSSIPTSGALTSPEYLNYNFAIQEFTQSGGIPAGPNAGNLRMPVGIVCNADGDSTQLTNALNHLIFDLHVPVIVSAIDTVTLRTVLTNNTIPNNVMVVNALGANSLLTILDQNYLVWHMLGQPSDVAAAYQAFFPRMEAYVRQLQNIPAGTPVRVATVTGNATDTGDLQTAASNVVSFNGMTLSQNQAAGNYVNTNIDTVLAGNTDLGSIQIAQPEMALGTFNPNIVVSWTSVEFEQLIETYEIDIGSGQQYAGNQRPFYLYGPYNVAWPNTASWIQPGVANATSEAKRKRVAGIGFASATDKRVLNAYQSNFMGAGNPTSALGYENFYDAMYFGVYSIVAAGHVPNYTGLNLGQGMLRLVTGPTYQMGQGDMASIFAALSTPTATVSLLGALGPPDFTLSTGARVSQGSVYCIADDPMTGAAGYNYDVLTLGAADGGAPTLTGSFGSSCYSTCAGDAGTTPDGGACLP